MSEVVENVSEQNSANTKEVTALPTETVENITTNNVESALKAVPEAEETVISATNKDSDGSGSKQAEEKLSASPKVVDNKKTPVKRTPTKRMSYIERAQKESEELVKNMGGNLEIEGGRRTRSSTRGTPTRSAAASTPPPAKKARTSPASGASTPTRPRGRGRKIDVAENTAEETKSTPSKHKTPTKGKKAAAKNVADEVDEAVEKSKEAKKVEEPFDEKKDETKETPLSSEKRKESTDNNLIENPIDDKTDGALKTVVEETQSQVAADILSTEKNVTKGPENTSAPPEIVPEVSEAVKNDSPMEAEDTKSLNCLTEKNEAKHEESTAPAEKAFQKVKEPTPEPMEVDSNSKSNDGLEQMDDDVVEINEDETKVVHEPVKVIENQQTSADIKSKNFGELKNVANTEDVTKENSVASSAIAAPPADGIVTNNSIAKPVAVADVANAHENNTEETKPAANDLNKTENDLCEPKIATSPPISAANDNSTVTTPQTCN